MARALEKIFVSCLDVYILGAKQKFQLKKYQFYQNCIQLIDLKFVIRFRLSNKVR